jgi:hypothetical protein
MRGEWLRRIRIIDPYPAADRGILAACCKDERYA